MAKFLKSLFTPEKNKNRRLEGDSEEDKSDFTPPLDGRRKLSISRSGRMRQAQKKRHSLTLDLYGEHLQSEKPKSVEYHVNNPVNTSENNRRHSLEQEAKTHNSSKEEKVEISGVEVTTPEEEIDLAFKVIDKAL